MKSSNDQTLHDVKENTLKSAIQKSEKFALQDFWCLKDGSGVLNSFN